MAFKILADTFSVARDSSHFIQIKTIKKPRSEEQVWLVVEIEGETKYARATVQNMIETVEDVFFVDPEQSAYERFEATLKEINVILKNLKEKRGAKSLGSISAILAAFTESELHLTQSKQAEAYLVRKGKLSMISEGLGGGKSEDLFVNIASGELMPDDKVIFTTSRLLRLATQSQLVQLLNDGVTEAVDAMRELVMAENELSLGVGCVSIKLPQRSTEAAEGFAFELPDFLKGLKPWLKKITDAFQEKVGKKMPLGKAAKFMPKLNWSRKNILAALLGVVLVLVMSVSFLIDSRRNDALRKEYQTRIEQLNADLETATTKGYGNEKETANAILDKVERESRDILGANFFREEVMLLLQKAQTTRDSINNTVRLKDVKPYADLKAKKATVKALGLLGLNDKLFAYEFNSVFEVILDQVLDPKPLDETEVVTSGTAMEDQDLIAFLTQSGRIMEYKDGQASFANTADAAWQAGTVLKAYGRNLYLLAPIKNQIYKYSRLRSSYSASSEYNADADVSNGISMAIDGNVYVLKQGGEIVKIFKSNAQPFKVADLAVDLTNATKIFTSLELNRLYVLDPINKRVVIIEKDKNGVARYYGQVMFEGLSDVKDLYVSKNEDKLYLLTDTAIYQAQL